jgi:hypothetical protein
MMKRIAVRYGIIMGVTMCFYTIFMWISKLDTTYLRIGQFLDIIVTLVPVVFIVLAIRAVNSFSPLTIVHRISIGLAVSFVSFLIYTPFLYFYHHFFNPDWLQYVLDLKQQDLELKGVSSSQIKMQLDAIRAASTDRNFVIAGFAIGVILMGSIISLLTIPFIRRRKS